MNRERGCNLPLMNLHERVLSVLGCRFVDDVLIDAPEIISPQMIQSLRIAEVIRGSKDDNFLCDQIAKDRYMYAKEAGIYKEIPSPTKFTLANIIERIQSNQKVFQAKIAKKKKAEAEYYEDKYNTSDKEEKGSE